MSNISAVLTSAQKILVTLNPDRPLAGPPIWTNNSARSTTITPSEDGLSAWLRPEAGPASDYSVRVQADAGHSILESIISMNVVDPEATDLNPVASPPVLA